MGLTERAWTQYQACRDADEIMVQTAIQTPDTNDPVLVNLTLTDAVYLLKHHAEADHRPDSPGKQTRGGSRQSARRPDSRRRSRRPHAQSGGNMPIDISDHRNLVAGRTENAQAALGEFSEGDAIHGITNGTRTAAGRIRKTHQRPVRRPAPTTGIHVPGVRTPPYRRGVRSPAAGASPGGIEARDEDQIRDPDQTVRKDRTP